MSALPLFISEVSSNHAKSIDRARKFIQASAEMGCQAVKFQLFKIDQLFASEILERSEEHRKRVEWELPEEFLPELKSVSTQCGIQFSCTPFFLDAVGILEPYVDFYKIASYELLWDDLISECARTGKPLILSTGMADLSEISHAVEVFQKAGGTHLTLLHCVSGYPAPADSCNLAAIETIREATGLPVGWSDHSRDSAIVNRAIDRYEATAIEFHLDLDEQGAEYKAGHCWLPHEMKAVIDGRKRLQAADGDGQKKPTAAEIGDRPWRADPSDGLRPLIEVRQEWLKK
ncbi:N-acetylneuraminate synthase family protein [Kordiimonas sp. SCSIO 12603]|uniref:N-acetylneuraminate synthase family protein n=1 Tax=Kordiimonas sp. SCSIO 12603 TaxID=2829596 RepID=UPI0021075E86|nr:N-acetylneuraminate synthase family protein [Kordiimonas sp. SCSIO 12603]UTW57628.1 N-acetylneuraminate synthase family protein [Kordiimonas sp. SCSIO 12603]